MCVGLDLCRYGDGAGARWKEGIAEGIKGTIVPTLNPDGLARDEKMSDITLLSFLACDYCTQRFVSSSLSRFSPSLV